MVKAGSIIIDIAANTTKLVAGMTKAQKSVKSAVSAMKTAIAGLAIGSALKEAISAGFGFNKSMEENVNGIKSLIAATSQMVDSNGDLLTAQGLLNIANQEAIGIVKELNKINSQTPHTLDETNKIFKALLPGMRSLGVEYKDIIKVTKQVSIAAGAQGIKFQQLLASVDGLATGMVKPNSELGMFFNSLGLTNKALKETDDIVQLVESKLGAMRAFDTMEVAVSELTNAWDKFTGRLTKTAFGDTKTAIKALSKYINDMTDSIKPAFITLVAYAEQVKATFTFIFEALKLGMAGLTNGVKVGFLKMVSELQASLASLLYSMKNLPLGMGEGMAEAAKSIMLVSNQVRESANSATKDTQNQLAITKAAQEEMNIPLHERINTLETLMDTVDALNNKEINAATVAKENAQAALDAAAAALEAKKQQIAQANALASLEASNALSTYNALVDIQNTANGITPAMISAAEQVKTVNDAARMGIIRNKEEIEALYKSIGDSYVENMTNANNTVNTQLEGIKDLVGTHLENAMTQTFRSWMDGALEFKDLMGGILKDIAAELFRMTVVKQAVSGADGKGGLMSLFGSTQAHGGAWSNGVQKFATGGIVNAPTAFGMNNGTGLMGEAGPEAIMPLTRIGADLGVKTSPSPVNLTVINNAGVNVSEQSDEAGNVQIVLDKIASDISRGSGPIGSAMERRYGLNKR